MYLWKCWRDTRVKVFVAFGVILLVDFFILASAIHVQHFHKPGRALGLLQATFMIPSGLLLFFGWILSKENPGADIGNGCGDFLLTRPSSRGRLVWTGWMVGMAESVILWIVLSAIAFGALLLRLQQVGIPVLGAPQTRIPPGSVLLVFAIFLLNLGLIYGLAYCIGVVTRNGSWALIGSAIVVIGYGFLESLLRQHWNIHLPDFFLPLHGYDNGIEIPSMLAFVVHGCLLVVFPAVAHFALERMEV